MIRMFFQGWSRSRQTCGLLVMTLLPLTAVSGMEPYWSKPDWWDRVSQAAVLQEEGRMMDIHASVRDKTREKFRLPLRDWLVMGPFPAPQQLNTRHSLDETPVFDQQARYAGPKGQQIGWANLETKRKDQAGEFEPGNFIVYLANVLDTPTDGSVWLLIGHDDGLKLWVNERQAYTQTTYRGKRIADRTEIQMEQRGRQRLFAKLHQQNGPWGIDMEAYSVDPLQIDVFAQAYALTRPSSLKDNNWMRFSQQLVDQFVRLGDL